MVGVVFANPFGEYTQGESAGRADRLKQEQVVFQTIVQPALSAREKQLDRSLKAAIAGKRLARSSANQSAAYSKNVQARRGAGGGKGGSPVTAGADRVGPGAPTTAAAGSPSGPFASVSQRGPLGFGDSVNGGIPFTNSATRISGTTDAVVAAATQAAQTAPQVTGGPATDALGAALAAPVTPASVPRSEAASEAIFNRYGEAGTPRAPAIGAVQGAQFTADGQLVRPVSNAVPGRITRSHRGATFDEPDPVAAAAAAALRQQLLINTALSHQEYNINEQLYAPQLLLNQ